MSKRDAWSKFGAIHKWMVPVVVANLVYSTGTPTVQAQAGAGIASITDTGTGDMRIVFDEAMPDANYVCLGSANTQGDHVVSFGDKTTAQVDANIETSDTLADIGFDLAIFLTNG